MVVILTIIIHRKALQTCKPLDGPEVREMVRCRLEEERGRTEEVVEQHRLRLAEQQKAYQALEDEFRMALRIEASRYQEVRERERERHNVRVRGLYKFSKKKFWDARKNFRLFLCILCT